MRDISSISPLHSKNSYMAMYYTKKNSFKYSIYFHVSITHKNGASFPQIFSVTTATCTFGKLFHTHTHTFETINRHIHTKMCTHTPREHTLVEVAAHASRASLAATAVPLTRRDANRPATLRCDIHHGPAMRGAPPPGAQP